MSDYVTYEIVEDAGDVFNVKFEYEPAPGDHGATQKGSHDRVRKMFRAALRPLVAAAGEVVQECRELEADSVELRFGVKAAGEAGWMVAKAASEANFEVCITWRADGDASGKGAGGGAGGGARANRSGD
ncbi:hypothetical protein KDL01_06775 [Actinospica durhamensis]|uniref:Trypsin-co-occurring domain-containing protein n=1 Tax=Actinospica durhamensis TaxID=1508375 RepID=A0A941EL97_9ACTN|nr:CU044_2847 family protein [Actinospica durhamensis]MBR7832958.1 hypothetical protein [Actinospica durhamensis]